MFKVCDASLRIVYSDWISLALAKNIAHFCARESPSEVVFVVDTAGIIVAGFGGHYGNGRTLGGF